MKRVLFLVNGYGLGNSTRAHSIIEQIASKYKVDIFGYGNSINYFKQVSRIDNIFQSFPLEHGLKNGKIDIKKTLGKLIQNLKSIYKSRKKLKEILESQNYNLIISDSNFSTLFLKNRPKLISINNSDRIIQFAGRIKKRHYLASWLIEWADYIYNKTVSDLVISPFFEPLDSKTTNRRKFMPTALMVRKNFQNPCFQTITKHHILIIPSGACVNFAQPLNFEKAIYNISIVGNQITALGKVQKYDKIFDTSHLMKQASIAVINGGLSSISEALAMRKPMIIIPVRGHLEQKINADWLEDHGIGLISSWEKLKKSISEMIKDYDKFKNNLIKYQYVNGAKQATDFILKQEEL